MLLFHPIHFVKFLPNLSLNVLIKKVPIKKCKPSGYVVPGIRVVMATMSRVSVAG